MHMENGIYQGDITTVDTDARKYLDQRLNNLDLGTDGLQVDAFGIPITPSGMRVSIAQHIDLREHFNQDEPPTDFGPAVLSAIVEANKTAADGQIQPVYIPVGLWRIETTVTVTDLSVVLTGPGIFDIQAASGLFNITQNQEAGLAGAVSVIRSAVDATALSANYAPDYIFTPTVPASILGLKNGDIVYLDSNTSYTPTWVSVSGSSTYKGQWFPIYGQGINVSMTAGKGGIPADSYVIGETSGARARVRGNRRLVNQSGTEVSLTFSEVLDKVTGQPSVFQNGETLTTAVGTTITTGAATVTSAPYIMSSVRLLDMHETGAQIHKITNPNMIVDLDVKHTTTGNTEAIIGSANRKIAIQLNGLIDSRVNVYTKDGWTRSVRWQGCFAPIGRGYCIQLPNDADTDEQAYGYFFEAYGSTEFGDFSFIARNCRHAFTDNTTATAGRITTGNTYSRTGVPKWNTVHDSKVIGNIGAGIDGHGGAWEPTYRDCHVVGSNGGRPTTASIGFQIRGANAKIIDCSATGVALGFRLASNTFNYDWDYEVELVNCRTYDCNVSGFEIGAETLESATPSHVASFVLRGCVVEGDATPTATSGNSGAGFLLVSGQSIQLHGCHSSKFGNMPLLVSNLAPTGSLGRIVVMNHTFDYLGTASTIAPISVTGVPVQPIVLDKLTALTAAAASAAPPSFWVQVLGVTTGVVSLRVGEFSAPYRTNNVTTLSLINGTLAANVEAIAIRRQGSSIYGQLTYTVPVLAAGASATATITATGATASDVAQANFSVAVPVGVIQEAPRVSTDSVTVRFTNIATTASVASSSGTLSTIVTKRGAVV